MKSAAELGRLVARLLAGAWRRPPPPQDLTVAEVEAIAPLLHRSGAAALAWRRLREGTLGETPAVRGFRQAYRLYTLEAAAHRREVGRAFATFRAASVEPILGKGWAIARLYPEEGLRPYADIDLFVRPEQRAAALALLPDLASRGCAVDLHEGFGRFGAPPVDGLYARSALVGLNGSAVRVFGAEDHLRLLALHMLVHGAWRPLWLCDLAVALEARTMDFNWDAFFGDEPSRGDWAACALGLAHALLGVALDGLPAQVRDRRLPHWLPNAVLAQWGRVEPETPQGARRPMLGYLRRPAGLLHALRLRWPNPIEATVGVGGPFNEMPRLPFQIGECLFRAVRFTRGLGRGPA